MKVCCQLSLFSHTQARVDPYTNLVRAKSENQVATWRAKEIRRLFERQKKSKFSPKSELRFRSTCSKPILIREVSRNSMELLSLSEGKLIILLQVMNNPNEIIYHFKNKYQNKIGIFVKLKSKVFMRWKN